MSIDGSERDRTISSESESEREGKGKREGELQKTFAFKEQARDQ